MKSTALWATPLVVSSQENTPATATIRKICAVRYIDVTETSQNSRQLISRCTPMVTKVA